MGLFSKKPKPEKPKPKKDPFKGAAKANAKTAKQKNDIEVRAKIVTRKSKQAHEEIGGPIKPNARHKKKRGTK